MGLREEYDFTFLVNESENMVIKELESQLKRTENKDICKCQDCILDILALSLNNLKPAYRSSFKGIIYSQGLKENDVLFKKEVANAIDKIKRNPSHG